MMGVLSSRGHWNAATNATTIRRFARSDKRAVHPGR